MSHDSPSRRLRPLGLLALLPLALLPSCQTEALAERRMLAVSATPPTPAPSTGEDREQLLERLTPPERDAPADARTAAGGVLWTLVSQGAGEPPEPDQSVTADVTVWRTDGSLVFSTFSDVAGITFDLKRLPQGLRAELVQVRPGGHARFWLPASALASWKPTEWPDTDLIIDYQLIEPRPARSSGSLRAPPQSAVAFPPPPPGEPPVAAQKTPEGIAHLALREGQSRAPASSSTLQLRVNAWTLRGLMVSPLVEGHALALRLDRAPAVLRPLLAGMKAGGVERLWLPAALADSVLPSTDGKPTVVDIELVEIQG